jgi:uncharacterized membrane protein
MGDASEGVFGENNLMSWVILVLINVVAYALAMTLYKIEAQRQNKPMMEIVLVTTLTAVLVYLPVFIYLLCHDPVLFTDRRWLVIYGVGLVVASAAGGLNVLAIKLSELSVIGPLDNLRPVFVMLLSLIILREAPSLRLLVGIGLIVVGAFVLQKRVGWGELWRQYGSRFMILSAGLYALLGIFDKMALAYIRPEYAAMMGLLGMTVVYGTGNYLRTKRLPNLAMFSWRLVVCGILMMVGSVSILMALKQSTPNFVIPLQMTRTFLISWFGFWLFKEKEIRRKLLAGLVMFAGVVMIVA